MIYGFYLSTAGAMAQNYRLNVIANNIANVDTGGFRKQFAPLQARPDHLSEYGYGPAVLPDDPRRMDGGVHLYDAPSDMDTQGAYQTTYRQLDMAIDGPGFFEIKREDGTFLTRDGAMTCDERGFLIPASGKGQFVGTGGEPIRIDPNNVDSLAIMEDGRIFQNQAADGEAPVFVPLGQLAISTPPQGAAMRRVGDNLFEYGGESEPATGKIRQGLLEGSNVEPINQMTGMIETQRAFQLNINMIQLQADTLATLIQQVPAQQ